MRHLTGLVGTVCLLALCGYAVSVDNTLQKGGSAVVATGAATDSQSIAELKAVLVRAQHLSTMRALIFQRLSPRSDMACRTAANNDLGPL